MLLPLPSLPVASALTNIASLCAVAASPSPATAASSFPEQVLGIPVDGELLRTLGTAFLHESSFGDESYLRRVIAGAPGIEAEVSYVMQPNGRVVWSSLPLHEASISQRGSGSAGRGITLRARIEGHESASRGNTVSMTFNLGWVDVLRRATRPRMPEELHPRGGPAYDH